MPSIAEILLEQGRQRANARRQEGAISAGMWTNLADVAARTGGQISEELRMAPIRKQEEEARALQLQGLKDEAAGREASARESAALRQLFSGETAPSQEDIYAVVGPERGVKIVEGLAALQDTELKRFKTQKEVLAATLAGMDAIPEEARAEFYPAVRQNLLSRGIITEQDAPEGYDPQWWQQARSFGQAPQKTPDLIQRDPTKDLIDPRNPTKPLLEGKPEEKPDTRSLQIQANDALKRGDTKEYARIRRVIKETSEAGRAPVVNVSTAPPEVDAPLDPESQDLMSHAGLSYNAFLALTGRMSQLPRDKETRNRASAEVAQWARTRGMDVSTLASQYKAFNDVLESNIQRYNRTQMAEGEIAADVENLITAAKESGLGDVRAINAAKQWARGELNDPNAAQYAFFLNQLTNDIALYNAASQGRAALDADHEEAKSVVRRGIAAGSLQGMQKAITASVEKMGTVLEGGVNRARQNVWKLFGVGDKYKPVTRSGKPPTSGTTPGMPSYQDYLKSKGGGR